MAASHIAGGIPPLAAGPSRPGQTRLFLAQFLGKKTVIFGSVVLGALVVLAVFAPWISSLDPMAIKMSARLRPPSEVNWFGTDEFGRDIFTRIIYAARVSLLVGVCVVVLASLIGITLGLVAGMVKPLDALVSRVTDAMMAFPDILLAISLVAAFGPSVTTVIIVLGVVSSPRLARIVRASTLVIRELPYVEAARALGIPTWRIMTRHVLRNLVSPILVQASFIFAHAILAEASLSFLGLGVSPDVPTWGTMIAAGRQYIGLAGWVIFFPGLAVVLAVLSLQLVGDALRDSLDPRLSKALK